MVRDEMLNEETIQRISALKPSDLAEDVLAAVEALGGEAQRVDIIDRALELRGWSEDERAVVSWYTGAARKYHLRTLADYAVTVCKDRGQLTEGATRGRWRLAHSSTIHPHRFGRVFTAGVGVGDDPVSDDWSATDQEHIWLSQKSLQISRGDHLFVLGAGRKSVVLGLYEVASAGTSLTPRNPWDPARWPYAISVRALAAVPPRAAIAVRDLTAPRGTANLVADEARRNALYAAVRDHAIEASAQGTATHPQQPDTGAVRRARPFDPEHRPAQARSPSGSLDLEETLALQEKARHAHHALLTRLYERLWRAGWRDLEEIPAAIDLRGSRTDGTRAIFEAKTISDGNETAQCRGALAQLLEYRLEYGRPDDLVCLVVNAELSSRRVEILERLGIAVVEAGDRRLAPLNPAGTALLSTAPSSTP